MSYIWTNERPTVPGWYFMKRTDIKGEPYGIAQVRSFPFHLHSNGDPYIEVYVADRWQSLNAFVRDVQCQWAGPITEPKEA